MQVFIVFYYLGSFHFGSGQLIIILCFKGANGQGKRAAKENLSISDDYRGVGF